MSVALVQQVAFSQNVYVGTINLPGNVTAGSTLVLSISDTGGTPTSVTGGGVTWSLDSGSGYWYGANSSGGPGTSDITINSSSIYDFIAGNLSEWSGMPSTASLVLFRALFCQVPAVPAVHLPALLCISPTNGSSKLVCYLVVELQVIHSRKALLTTAGLNWMVMDNQPIMATMLKPI